MKKSLQMPYQVRFPLAFLFLFKFVLSPSLHAQTYTDNASSYGGVWGPTNPNNSNSCSNVGFGDWAFTYGTNSGTFIGNPSDNGMGTTGIGTTAFGMYATGSQYCNAYRSIRGGMQVGDALSFYWAINWNANVGGGKGFDLRNGGNNIFNVNNSNDASIATTNGTAFDNTRFGTAPMLVTLTRISSTSYSFSMTARDGGASYSTIINNNFSIDGINFYIGNQNDGNGNRDMYLNAFQLTKLFVRYRSSASGNWSDPLVWQISTNGGSSWSAASSAPTGIYDAITIQNVHSITLNTSASIGSLVIDAGGTFNNGTAQTLTMAACNATITNNGTFNRNTGTVTFSNTGTVSGPVGFHNLNISGGLTLGAGANQSTIHGTFSLNPGGFIAASAPKYATESTLVYNTGGTFNRANEWPSGETPGTVPHHVKIEKFTTLNLDVTGDFNGVEGRSCLGDLDIYGVLTMGGEGGTMAEDLKVGGNVYIRKLATLTLGAQLANGSLIGDIWVEGDWVHETDGNFIPSRRAVWFVGSNAEQTVSFSGIERFAYFVVNKPGNGIVKMNCDAYVYGTNRGSNFQMLNGRLDLNGKNFTVSVRDSLNKVINTTVDLNLNVLIDGSVSNLTREIINSSASPATFNFTHYDNTQHVAQILRNDPNDPLRAASLSFGTNVMVTIGAPSAEAGVNFGNTITTINGTLRINARGYVDVNPPTYASNSLLQYNIGDTYNRNAEWNAASGPGYPFNVQTSLSGTRLIAGGAALSGGAANTASALNMAGSLTIDAGTTFDMTNGTIHNMTVPLTVGLDINIAGTLLASQEADGNIILGRNWSRTGAGVFTPYARSVTFNTGTDASLSAPAPGETFYNLIINKPATGVMGSSYQGFRVTLNSPAQITNNINLTSGIFVTTSTNIITVNSGASATGGGVESFVSGPMRKTGTTGTTDFSFPVGKLTNVPATGPLTAIVQYHYRPIAIGNLDASADYTAQFYRDNPYLRGPISNPAKNKGLQLISYCEYWDLTRVSGTDKITVTPSWSTHAIWSSKCNVVDYVLNSTALVVVPYNGTNPIPGSSPNQWGDEDFGQTSVGTGNQSYIQTISWTGALNYNKFVLGSINWRLAPLPFEIKNFKVAGKDKKVQLNWQVNNNDQVRIYTIERSRNGIQFETMKQVLARFNESTSSYIDLDPVPYNGWGYYRLRITDLQGNVSYSNIQKVWMGQAVTNIQISPNPAKNILWVNLSEPEKVTEISIVNSIGQLLLKQNRLMSTNQLNISALQPGVYYVRIVGQNGINTEVFVKQ